MGMLQNNFSITHLVKKDFFHTIVEAKLKQEFDDMRQFKWSELCEEYTNTSQVNKGQGTVSQFIIAGSDSAKLLQLYEKRLHQMPFFTLARNAEISAEVGAINRTLFIPNRVPPARMGAGCV